MTINAKAPVKKKTKKKKKISLAAAKKEKLTNYEMWITSNNEKQKLCFPVLPEKITISYGQKQKSVDIAGLGDVLFQQGRVSPKIKLESFFPKAYFPGCSYKAIPKPKNAVSKIVKIKKLLKPAHFFITGAGINMYVFIQDFQVWQQGGDPGTIYFSLSLIKYTKVSVKKINTKRKKKKSGGNRVNNATTPATYKVKKGDSLFTIAKKFYGDGKKQDEIYKANKKAIGSNRNKLKIGTVLKLPKQKE